MPSLDFEKEKKEFRKYYNDEVKVFEQASSSLATLIALLLTDHDKFDTPRVISRVKDREECVKKFERKYLKKLEEDKTEYEIKDHISDIIGIRIITLYDTDIKIVKEVLLDNFELIDITDKTQSLEEKDDVFGYKGLHLDLRLNKKRTNLPEYKQFKDIQFEVQIRTTVQDAWSILDHKIKYKRNIPQQLKRRINRLAALFELSDQEFINIQKETIELENKAKEIKEEASQNNKGIIDEVDKLDAFVFLKVMHTVFPTYEFYGYKVDGFIDELKKVNPDITVSMLEEALNDKDYVLEEYQHFQYKKLLNSMNPYTITRHALYLKDKEKHKSLLFDLQRNTFDEWLKEQEAKKKNG